MGMVHHMGNHDISPNLSVAAVISGKEGNPPQRIARRGMGTKQNRLWWFHRRLYSGFCHQNALHQQAPTAHLAVSFLACRWWAPLTRRYCVAHLLDQPNAQATCASITRRSLWQFRFSPCPYASRQFFDLERMDKKSASPIVAHGNIPFLS